MPKYIMVFSDSKDTLVLFEAILSDAGYEMILDTYGVPGTKAKRITAVLPDLVILDCSVYTESKAWEVIQYLKLNSATLELPIILATTHAYKMDERKEYLSTKHITVLPQPFDMSDLLAIVEKAFTRKDVLVDPNVDQ